MSNEIASKQYVTAAEVKNLIKFVMADDIVQIARLAKELDPKTTDFLWNDVVKAVALYTAGKVQGIREERQRRAVHNK